jgi:integrase
MVDTGFASSATLQLDGPASPAVALWRLVGALTQEQTRTLASEIELLAGAAWPQQPSGPPRSRTAEGVRARHSQWCSRHQGGACGCSPRWEAWVYSRTDKAKIRKTFSERWQAKAWRHEQLDLASIKRLRAPSRCTLNEAASLWVKMAQEGRIRNRSGRHYKPSALRTIETDLRLHLVPSLGARAMVHITRADLQELVGGWLAAGSSPSKVRSIVNAARVLWRDLDLLTGHDDDQLLIDPTRGLRLPASTGRRERIATCDEARRLIEALQPEDGALWATAMYAGLRHGELRALQVRDVDLERHRINVRRGWDQYEGEIDPKSRSGTRPTIITKPLHHLLTGHLRDSGREGRDLIFGRTPTKPFQSSSVNKRVRKAWAAARKREDSQETGLPGERIRSIGLQECRHTAVSQMLDAGIAIDKVSKFMGHASITITIDRYGHLLPGGEADAIALLDAYHQQHERQ